MVDVNIYTKISTTNTFIGFICVDSTINKNKTDDDMKK